MSTAEGWCVMCFLGHGHVIVLILRLLIALSDCNLYVDWMHIVERKGGHLINIAAEVIMLFCKVR